MKTQNEMKLTFQSLSVNEGFARSAVASFISMLDPTVSEIADIKTAVSEAVNGKSGILPIFKRKNTENYDIEIGTVPVEAVANKIKRVDKKYITERANNVTDELLHYLAPLIEGEIDIPKIHGVPKHFIIK